MEMGVRRPNNNSTTWCGAINKFPLNASERRAPSNRNFNEQITSRLRRAPHESYKTRPLKICMQNAAATGNDNVFSPRADTICNIFHRRRFVRQRGGNRP